MIDGQEQPFTTDDVGRMALRIQGFVESIINGCLSGWAHVPGSGDRLDIVVFVNGVQAATVVADQHRPDLVAAGIGDGRHGFFVAVGPEHFHPAQPAALRVIARHATFEAELPPGLIHASPADGFGHLESVAHGQAHGWVVPRIPGSGEIRLELLVDGEVRGGGVPTLLRQDMTSFRLADRPTGFSLPLPPEIADGWPHRVEVRVAESGTLLLGGPHTIRALPAEPPAATSQEHAGVSREALCRELTAVAELLHAREQGGPAAGSSTVPTRSAAAATWIRTAVIPELLQACRAGAGDTFHADLRIPMPTVMTAAAVEDGVTDVVIPVYGGRDQTLACIASVRAATGDCPHEIVVIDDGTPEPDLAVDLQRLAAEGAITLVVQDRNRGFVASANAGMVLHTHRDVVLLNSDTVVPPGWLARLRRAAYATATIGTVTPFSNRATICGFPSMPGDNDLPAGWTVAELDAACAHLNAGLAIDIPTAVGFCMYIRRAAIHETGLFDEVTWGRGYGEENDFCLRAAARGWRNVQACDVFVQHHGSASFAGDKAALVEAHLAVLCRMYPDYLAAVERHIQADPAAPARRRVLKEIYQREAAARVLFITHTLGGGTQVAVDALTSQLGQEGVATLVLTARSPDRWRLARPGDAYGLDYRMPDDMTALLHDLQELGVWHIHCHHLIGFDGAIFLMIDESQFAYDVSLHDYLWICPRINLLDGSFRYCGEPAAEDCDRCIQNAGVFPGLEGFFHMLGGRTAGWREAMARILRRARRVIAPSADVAARIRRHIALDNLLVRPHPEPAVEIEQPGWLPANVLNVAVIGAVGKHKGFATLRACAAEAAARGLPLHFTVIGYTCEDAALRSLPNVTITGSYDRQNLSEIAQSHGCHVGLFMSPGPETFSFTLSEAWRAGLYPVVPDIGAPADRVRETGYGEIYDRSLTTAQILELLLTLAERSQQPTRMSLGTTYSSLLRDYYGLVERAGGQPAPAVGPVCVLGMHRSGTSVLAGGLAQAGLATGHVLRFGADNFKGHIESALVIGVNDAVLQASGGTWRHVPPNLTWTDAERRRRDTIVAEIGCSGAAWVFKDPRTLLTLAFWQEGLPGLVLVGTFRHPLKVAFSLFQRNMIAIDEGLRLWTAYNRRLIAQWERKAFPLVCFDLPPDGYRAALARAIDALAAELRRPLDAGRGGDFFTSELHDAAVPKPVLDNVSAAVASDLTAALATYDRLLACAGITPTMIVHSDLGLPLVPTVENCRRLLAAQPGNTKALTMLATVLEQGGDRVAACAARREVVRLAAGNYLALRGLLDALVQAGLHDEAYAWATQALPNHPDNPDLHAWLGAACAARGDRGAAMSHYRVARDADYQYFSTVARLAALADCTSSAAAVDQP